MNIASISVTLSPILQPTIPPIFVQIPQTNASTTDYVAWAGFILSLLLGVFEFWKYLNDRPKLKITARYNQQIMGMNRYGDMTNQETGKTFWTIDVANTGSKQIIITSISFKQSSTTKMAMLTKDYAGEVNRYTLIPGDKYSYTIGDDLLNPKKVIEAHVFDATGKVYKKKLKYKL